MAVGVLVQQTLKVGDLVVQVQPTEAVAAVQVVDLVIVQVLAVKE